MNTGRSKQTPYSCVVADFGLAEKVPTNETEIKILQEKHSTGCIYVVAPEVIHSKPYDQTVCICLFGLKPKSKLYQKFFVIKFRLALDS